MLDNIELEDRDYDFNNNYYYYIIYDLIITGKDTSAQVLCLAKEFHKLHLKNNQIMQMQHYLTPKLILKPTLPLPSSSSSNYPKVSQAGYFNYSNPRYTAKEYPKPKDNKAFTKRFKEFKALCKANALSINLSNNSILDKDYLGICIYAIRKLISESDPSYQSLISAALQSSNCQLDLN